MAAPNDDSSNDCQASESVKQAMIDALADKETMFKNISVGFNENYYNNNRNNCTTSTTPFCPRWPVTMVRKRDFSVSKEEIGLIGDKENQLGERSYEYGASWVEHYYCNLVTLCKQQDRMDLVRMLYHWYIAQFSLDYMNDVAMLSKEQYMYASNVLQPENSADSRKSTAIQEHRFASQLQACRDLMQEHDNALHSLPTVAANKISGALKDFYEAVAQQCDAQKRDGRFESDDHCASALLDSMSMNEYMDYRTINAGGLMGFVRQTCIIAMLDSTTANESFVFPPTDRLQRVSHLVGKNVALINDLYGLRKDKLSGEPNIVLKHARETRRSRGNDSEGSKEATPSEASVSWALEEIGQTVIRVELYCKEHPDCLVAKHNIAMSCISGNHGFHESSKRYELPKGFSWTCG